MDNNRIPSSSPDLTQVNIEKMNELFPEIVTEGKVDFDMLKTVLGEEIDDRSERYKFEWHGKKESLLGSQQPSKGTLRPDKEASKKFDTTENLYIEGDNLEVLKLLQKSYNGKVKMINIDPPYNTGNDFVYEDDFKDNIQNYLEQTGQVDSEGSKMSTNTETSRRKHTNRLNMMYSRLKLARNLLTEDGVIFISIDDNEKEKLKMLCNDIFGEENFVAMNIHKNNSNKNQTHLIGVSTEYVFCYVKDLNSLENVKWRVQKKGTKDIQNLFTQLKHEGYANDEILEEVKEMYKRPKYSHLSRWNKIDDKGIFMDADLSRNGGSKNYNIINPETGKECVIPTRGWGKSEKDLKMLQNKGLIYYGNPSTPPREKQYIQVDSP